jgi:hypothetical protein
MGRGDAGMPDSNSNDPFYLTPHFLQSYTDDGEEDDTYVQLVPSEKERTIKRNIQKVSKTRIWR